jgi:hypothetical protein
MIYAGACVIFKEKDRNGGFNGMHLLVNHFKINNKI